LTLQQVLEGSNVDNLTKEIVDFLLIYGGVTKNKGARQAECKIMYILNSKYILKFPHWHEPETTQVLSSNHIRHYLH
jgi:hypothetical protein